MSTAGFIHDVGTYLPTLIQDRCGGLIFYTYYYLPDLNKYNLQTFNIG